MRSGPCRSRSRSFPVADVDAAVAEPAAQGVR
jgi:hypothetical protein